MRTAIIPLLHLFPHAHAGIEALGDDVFQAVAGVQLHLDIRIGRKEAGKLRPQDRFGRVLAGGDAHGSGRLVPERGDRIELGIDFLEATSCAAARVKLRSRATDTKASRSL